MQAEDHTRNRFRSDFVGYRAQFALLLRWMAHRLTPGLRLARRGAMRTMERVVQLCVRL